MRPSPAAALSPMPRTTWLLNGVPVCWHSECSEWPAKALLLQSLGPRHSPGKDAYLEKSPDRTEITTGNNAPRTAGAD